MISAIRFRLAQLSFVVALLFLIIAAILDDGPVVSFVQGLKQGMDGDRKKEGKSC